MIGKTRQPPRLREVLVEDAALARGLRAARALGPGEGEAEAIERRLFAAIGAGGLLGAANGLGHAGSAASGASGPVAASGSAIAALKVMLALAIGAGGITASAHLLRRARGPSGAAATRALAAPAVSPGAAVPPPALAEPDVGAITAQDAAPRPAANVAPAHPVARRRGARASAASGATTEPGHLERELELIEPARTALATDPERALALCAQHQREFPEGGVMTEEREAIAISALVKQQRLTEARRRQGVFEARYPASPYGGQLRERLKAASGQ